MQRRPDHGPRRAQLESLVLRQFPDVVVGDRIVHVATRKRIGHVLDGEQRSMGIVPLAAWDPVGRWHPRAVICGVTKALFRR